MSDESLELSIIIVSHNTRDYTLAALQSIQDTVKAHQYEVIVVENASTDQSAEAIEKAFPHIQLIKIETLIGFSTANNLGAKSAKGEYLFFLNPDTVVQPGAIELLLEHAKSLPNCGAISGQLLNPNNSIQPQGGALPNLFNVAAWMLFVDDLPFLSHLFLPYQQRNLEYFKKLHENCGWIGGTALMISRSLFEKLTGWDEQIYMYGEDVELCLRVHKAGKTACLYPGAKIMHHQNKSTGSSRKAKLGEFDGLLYLWKKHKPGYQMGILKSLLWIGSWLRLVIFGILGRNDAEKHTYFEAQKRILMA
jgi:GT2 family glycosyltransferase